MNQPEQRPVVLEARNEGLHHPSVHAHKADILPSTMKGQALDPATHQWQPRCRLKSSTLVRGHYPPRS